MTFAPLVIIVLFRPTGCHKTRVGLHDITGVPQVHFSRAPLAKSTSDKELAIRQQSTPVLYYLTRINNTWLARLSSMSFFLEGVTAECVTSDLHARLPANESPSSRSILVNTSRPEADSTPVQPLVQYTRCVCGREEISWSPQRASSLRATPDLLSTRHHRQPRDY